VARLADADRDLMVAHLAASSRYLALLSTRLAEGAEPEAAALVDAARADIDAVCRRLERRADSG